MRSYFAELDFPYELGVLVYQPRFTQHIRRRVFELCHKASSQSSSSSSSSWRYHELERILPTTLETAVTSQQLANCLIYAHGLLEYVIFILWLLSVSKMLLSVKFAEDKVLTFLILREKC